MLTACLQDLEEGLLESEKEGGCEFLTELVCKLLNGCYGREDIWWVLILSETVFSSQIVPKRFFYIIFFVLIWNSDINMKISHLFYSALYTPFGNS